MIEGNSQDWRREANKISQNHLEIGVKKRKKDNSFSPNGTEFEFLWRFW